MPRAKRGFKARRRRNKIMKAAKGTVLGRHQFYRAAVATMRRAWRYATRDRRQRKRQFRSLWITRINAGARQCGLSYSRLMGLLKQADVQLDRRMLADIAVHDMEGFGQIIESVRTA